MRETEREQRKAKGLLQGQKEVITYASKWEVGQGRIDDPAAKTSFSEHFASLSVAPLISKVGKNDLFFKMIYYF